MLSRRFATSRIPLRRPRRPPTHADLHPRPRCFTQHSQLLLVARHTPRPQLPYLSQPSFRRLSPLDQHVLRLLSTETRVYVKDQVWLAARWITIINTFLMLGGLVYWGVSIERDERREPTPEEWSYRTRSALRSARFYREDREGFGSVDWAKAGSCFWQALERLESGKDAEGVKEQEEGEGILIPDVGKAGLDISAKSWPWRAGYFEVLMGCAESAERLEGHMLETKRRIVFPSEFVVGPSNPDPRPPTQAMGEAPLEENCVPAFDPPESFYMRVLTGKGFSTKQRLDSAWKYATYLEYKGLHESAEEMYLWAVDIASSTLPEHEAIFDTKTAVLRAPPSPAARSTGPTENLLSATTALAVHRARTGDVASALPSLLSVLRARREAPLLPSKNTYNASSLSNEGGSDLDAAVSFIMRIFSPPRFPDPPPTGDDIFVRSSDSLTCEESELMLYVGEILFATSPSPSQGLDWTRQAVTIAEANLEPSNNQNTPAMSTEALKKCKSCLRTGVHNWESMLQQLFAQDSNSSAREGGGNVGWLEWRGWFGRGGGGKGKTHEDLRAGMLGEELKRVEAMRERITREAVSEEMYKHRGAGGGVWIG